MQRIALARALVLQPELLLLDEPTANLDPRSAASIDCLLHSLAGGRTAVILATHNMRQCHNLAGRVAVLQKGRLAAQGRAEEIFRSRAEQSNAFRPALFRLFSALVSDEAKEWKGCFYLLTHRFSEAEQMLSQLPANAPKSPGR